jgi:tRNA1Val (adenine37-N6)-methyltransferase
VFAAADLTEDGFLGGKLAILQPRDGYRAASDPVLLAASVGAQAGQRVLDLGCGAGVAGLCLARRVPGIELTGIEVQADYADLARRNAAANGIVIRVMEGDLATLDMQDAFDHILMNPPYFAPGSGTPADDSGRETALREATPMGDWMRFAARRLRPGGHLHVVQLIARLPEVLTALPVIMGSVAVLPLASRRDRPAGRFILRARKGGRAPFVMATPLILHAAARHEGDGEDHTEKAADILRRIGALEF